MPGDYSRLSFDPHKRHSELLMQQGRVQLDSDWNAMMNIVSRRWQVQATDTFGECAVPRETTPNAFFLTPVAGPPIDLQLGVGRLYADGLLAEILPDETFTYTKQPFLFGQPALDALGSDTALVFIDVWQREITYLEEPDLLEQALGGPDTSTRTQTVWQVKAIGAGTLGQPPSCDADLDALYPPSAGRLSTQAVATPSNDDPCVLPQLGGYRGVENRLYRVEIHDAGDATKARFKWSRDNASIESRVESIKTTSIVVSRIGRDPVLRFRVDDWVELLDDHTELAGTPGTMARVVKVNEATRTLTLDRDVTASFDTSDPNRHTRVRRWDQQSGVDGDGLLPISSSWVTLEDGVQVMLALDPTMQGGAFHTGDYWVFAARSADASVESLTSAPPRGIVHHYCVLGTVSGLSGGAPKAHDCRDLWPPMTDGKSCDCTVCVDPAEHNAGKGTIQDAIEAVKKAGGGKVCLEPGRFVLTRPIDVSGASSLTIVGHGDATTLVYVGPRPGPTMQVQRSSDVTIERLAIALVSRDVSPDSGADVGIVVDTCLGVTIQSCSIARVPSTKAIPLTTVAGDLVAVAPAAVDASAVDAAGVPAAKVVSADVAPKIVVAPAAYTSIIDPAPEAAVRGNASTAVTLDGVLVEVRVRDNTFVTDYGVRNRKIRASDHFLAMDLVIERNWLGCALGGVIFGAVRSNKSVNLLHAGTVVRDNLFLCDERGVRVEGVALLQSSVVVEGNEVHAGATAVESTVDRTVVRDNVVVGATDGRDPSSGIRGIGVASLLLAGRCTVTGNAVRHVAGNGVTVDGRFDVVAVDDNEIVGIAGTGVHLLAEGGASIARNEIRRVGTATTTKDLNPAGVRVGGLDRVAVSDNLVVNVGQNATSASERDGIVVGGVTSVVVEGNEIAEVGPVKEDDAIASFGVHVYEFNDVTVCGNSVRRVMNTAQKLGTAQWSALGVNVAEGSGDVTYSPTSGVLVSGKTRYFLGVDAILAISVDAVDSVAGNDNYLEGATSIASVVRIRNGGNCVFGANRCRLVPGSVADPGGPSVPATITIKSPRASVANNQVVHPAEVVSFDLVVGKSTYTVLGNVTSGKVLVDGAALGAPWSPLNVIGA